MPQEFIVTGVYIGKYAFVLHRGTTVVVIVSGIRARARESMHRQRKSGIFVVLSEITSSLRLFCFPSVTRRNLQSCVSQRETANHPECWNTAWRIEQNARYENAARIRDLGELSFALSYSRNCEINSRLPLLNFEAYKNNISIQFWSLLLIFIFPFFYCLRGLFDFIIVVLQ